MRLCIEIVVLFSLLAVWAFQILAGVISMLHVRWLFWRNRKLLARVRRIAGLTRKIERMVASPTAGN